jgi:hypothetical protein
MRDREISRRELFSLGKIGHAKLLSVPHFFFYASVA